MHFSWSSTTSYMAKRSVATEASERIERMASASAVVIFSMSTCCMCHAIKRLFCSMGVNPTVYEIDQDPNGNQLDTALTRMVAAGGGGGGEGGGGATTAVPVVFVGGKLVGSMDGVMASHINGTLVPLLKEAGALWL